jgi:HK97 family phage portal protein
VEGVEVSLFFGKAEARAMESWYPVDPSRRTVTPESATHLVPVFAAIRHIVNFSATLPVDSYRKVGGDRIEMRPPALISGLDAEGRVGLVNWLGQAFYGLVTRGNSVGWIVERDGLGFPSSVAWLAPDDWDFNETSKQWSVFGIPVASSSILHIPWIVPPGKTLGLSPIEHFAEAIGAGLSAQEYADIKRGGGNPPSILKNTQKTLESGAADLIRHRLMAALRKGEPLVTGADWDWSPVAIPPNHAEFIKTIELSANQTAAIYGLDPTEVGGPPAGGSLTYTTEESRQIRRAADMRPYIERFERAINRVLPDQEYIKLNTDATIRTDIKTRTEVVGAQVADGRMSINEARRLEDRAPIPGGDAFNVVTATAQRDVAETLQKIYLAVGSVITVDEAREIANAAGADLSPGGGPRISGRPAQEEDPTGGIPS